MLKMSRVRLLIRVGFFLCPRCGRERKIANNRIKGLCLCCYKGQKQFPVTLMGHNKNVSIPLGSRKEVKEFYRKEKSRILEDCIKNPKKYL